MDDTNAMKTGKTDGDSTTTLCDAHSATSFTLLFDDVYFFSAAVVVFVPFIFRNGLSISILLPLS